MVANKDEALRVVFANPKDAKLKLGKALQARYMEIREGIHAFKAAREGYPDLHDPAKLAFAAGLLQTLSHLYRWDKERVVLQQDVVQ